MKLVKNAAAIVTAVSLFGALAFAAWSFQPSYAFEAINAEVVPTQAEVKAALDRTHRHLLDAEKASFYNATAESDYLAAQRWYEYGRYDEAMTELRAAQDALGDIPNRVRPTTASR